MSRARYVPRVLAAYRAGQIQPTSLRLMCPRAVRLAQSDSRFHLIEHDLLAPAPFPGPVDVVRTMNVLNSSYFTQRQLGQVVGRIFSSLAAGGLLVTGSNDEAGTEVRGAIYRKVERGFVELKLFGHMAPSRKDHAVQPLHGCRGNSLDDEGRRQNAAAS